MRSLTEASRSSCVCVNDAERKPASDIAAAGPRSGCESEGVVQSHPPQMSWLPDLAAATSLTMEDQV